MVLLLSSLMALFLRRLYTYWIKAKMARFSLTHKMVNFLSIFKSDSQKRDKGLV